jgi:predicted nucleic acid-binding protein
MSAPDFLDTNILVYAWDSSSPAKQRIAQDLVRKAIAGEIFISTQVMAEFAVTMLHKISPAAKPQEIEALLDVLEPVKLVLTDVDTIRRAVQVRAKYGLHFYDGMIVAAAERGGCRRIWSEDMGHGQQYFGLVVENPFV